VRTLLRSVFPKKPAAEVRAQFDTVFHALVVAFHRAVEHLD
jgi:hypothetical protein